MTTCAWPSSAARTCDDRRLAAIDVEHRRLDADQPAFGGIVGHRVGDLADHVDAAALARRRVEAIERLAALDGGDRAARVDALGIDDAAVMARRDADDLPA